MFVAAARLRRSQPDQPRGYRAPMLVALCGIGFAASLVALPRMPDSTTVRRCSAMARFRT
jgi:hypothetical protein